MVPVGIFEEAIREFLALEPLHMAVFVFGVSVVLLFSVLEIWKHASKGAKI